MCLSTFDTEEKFLTKTLNKWQVMLAVSIVQNSEGRKIFIFKESLERDPSVYSVAL